MISSASGRRAARFLPAGILYLFIFTLSSLERWPVEVGWTPFDKVAHVSIFGLLGALLAFGFGRGEPKSAWKAFLTGVVLAALDEVHQLFVAGRDSSPWDLLADLGGIAAGIGIFRALARFIARGGRERARTTVNPPGKGRSDSGRGSS